MPDETVCSISHIVDRYVAYPGETVRLSTRISPGRTPAAMLAVSLPAGCKFMEFHSPRFPAGQVHMQDNGNSSVLNWVFEEPLRSGAYELVIEGQIAPVQQDIFLISEAAAYAEGGAEICAEAVRIAVRGQGRYMNYLPDFYRKDELMGRFLMLFESFWGPIERQIRQASFYFDPDLTPEKMLPWLASWVGAFWDEYLPVERQRQLLRTAVSQYQRRGTRLALEEFLHQYTGGRVNILEQPAHNFVMGETARLGQKVALGTQNSPHAFTVDVALPLENFNIPDGMDPALVERIFRQKLETIINLQKPAHTVHHLNLEIVRKSKEKDNHKSKEPERILYEQ